MTDTKIVDDEFHNWTPSGLPAELAAAQAELAATRAKLEIAQNAVKILVKERNNIAHKLAGSSAVVRNTVELIRERGWQPEKHLEWLESAGNKLRDLVEPLFVTDRRIRTEGWLK